MSPTFYFARVDVANQTQVDLGLLLVFGVQLLLLVVQELLGLLHHFPDHALVLLQNGLFAGLAQKVLLVGSLQFAESLQSLVPASAAPSRSSWSLLLFESEILRQQLLDQRVLVHVLVAGYRVLQLRTSLRKSARAQRLLERRTLQTEACHHRRPAVAAQRVLEHGRQQRVPVGNVPVLLGLVRQRQNDLLQVRQRQVDVLGLLVQQLAAGGLVHALTSGQVDCG